MFSYVYNIFQQRHFIFQTECSTQFTSRTTTNCSGMFQYIFTSTVIPNYLRKTFKFKLNKLTCSLTQKFRKNLITPQDQTANRPSHTFNTHAIARRLQKLVIQTQSLCFAVVVASRPTNNGRQCIIIDDDGVSNRRNDKLRRCDTVG